MTGLTRHCGLAGLLVWAVLAQIASPQKFDAAVIKPGLASGECVGYPNGTELNFTNCTLLGWIKSAFEIPPWQRVINNGPTWLNSERFSLRAKASKSLSSSQVLDPMWRQLLVDRFGLVWHREKQETQVFFL